MSQLAFAGDAQKDQDEQVHHDGAEGEIDPVGSKHPVKVDFRLISATNQNLIALVNDGRFREDLYYRLNVVPVHLPPLTERREDIPALVDHFVARYAAERRVPTPEVAGDAMAALQAYDWPGNVRQLRNVVERTIIMTPRERLGMVEPDMLPPEIIGGQIGLASDSLTAIMGVPLREARVSFEREYLSIQIRRFSGNISKTASFIGMERSALHRKLKLLGMADRREEDD